MTDHGHPVDVHVGFSLVMGPGDSLNLTFSHSL